VYKIASDVQLANLILRHTYLSSVAAPSSVSNEHKKKLHYSAAL